MTDDKKTFGRPTHCWNCNSPLPVFTYQCGICQTDNTPIFTSGAGGSMADFTNYKLTGCIFDKTAPAAPELIASSMRLPRQVDLRIHCSPIEDQLTTSSCVGNAVVGALEFHQKKAGLPVTDMSRLFVYYNARALSGTQGQDSGTLIHHGMASMLAHGICEAALWPFDLQRVTQAPPKACYENAQKYEAVQYARTPRGESALKALAQGLPIVFGMFAPMNYYNHANETGVMPKPDQVPNNQPPAGHSMLIVGYDLDDNTWLVRNSWGVRFAENGYLRIPFETMDAWAPEEAFWTIGAIEQAEGFKLAGPSMNEAMKSVGIDPEEMTVGGSTLDKLRADLRGRLSSDLETAKRDFRDRLRGKK
ncbi:C1 family peptidase [Henriciella mobilis]|uniref:Peptidase C1A papain C-terminal domain-containing protein n=1 Tax=Henriciella mobilis TaxID=2305467 RepID=A0A399RT89_9PROT|nr:C1 family peptidase [Henriciella mobilis]RIJ16814.1 hypothetical protein D1231_06570 [Henriciella mobilis]RIJ19503.1 hypothetical protein D1227_16640 [Henriciella mobilis]RIJ33082.1 hypothetical protein D1223_04370 [Henriciella mobilis]